jgi:hypothetical protein
MAKLIKVGIGMILSVEKINPEKDYDEWAWRKKYEKFLSVIEPVPMFITKSFLSIS